MTTQEYLSKIPNTRPIWEGSESSSKRGGVTQSLIGKFLACPERFKALVIDNLKPRWKFNHRIEYGNMFHLCIEHQNSNKPTWEGHLTNYVRDLLIKYPYDQEEIIKWSRICLIQFPVYLDYWHLHDNNPNQTSLLKEQVFHLPYELPSGRVVYLRGKWDGVSLSDGGVWVDESKTKGSVDKDKIERRLKYDLQTMIYLIALREYGLKLKGNGWYGELDNYNIMGVNYNVIRRPLSGGKGTIKQTKNETIDGYYNRLQNYIVEEPDTYFFRWKSEVSSDDIVNFEKSTLIPILEKLCYWWDYQNNNIISETITLCDLHFTMPYGVPHITDEYGTEYDDYITTGNTIGLETCNDLFPELNGE